MSPSMPIVLEPARPVEGDARQVMDWRNDPDTLRASYHREPKVWTSFWPEFQADYFPADAPAPVFALAAGERVGFLRFAAAPDPEGEGRRCADVSINLAPAHRGRGLAAAVLAAAHSRLRGLGVEAVYAEVREENAASRRAFEAAGYRPLGAAEKHVGDTGERCRIVRYLCELDG